MTKTKQEVIKYLINLYINEINERMGEKRQIVFFSLYGTLCETGNETFLQRLL